jgi:DNA-binding transcriptional LysR family regulator
VLLDYCAELARADRRFAQRLSDVDALEGEVGFITPGSIGLSLYPVLLGMQQANPGLIIRHRFAPDREVLDAVLQNRYELGLVTLKPEDERLAASHFTEEALELVVPAGEGAATWADLEKLGFIDHPDGQGMATRLLARRFPGNAGIRNVPCHGFSNQIGLILEPVARGLGFTVLPRYARQAFAKQDAIAVIECREPVVDTLWLIQRSEWPLSRRAAHVVATLRQRLAAAKSMPQDADKVLAVAPTAGRSRPRKP